MVKTLIIDDARIEKESIIDDQLVKTSIIDDSPMLRFHWRLLLQTAGGPFLDGWILSIIGVALVGMQLSLGFGNLALSLIGASALIGIFFGGALFGRLTDVIGRQLMYTLDLVFLVVCSVACAFVTEVWHIIALRFIVGVAIGADYPIATALLAEWLPAKRRVAMLGSLVIAWFAGATVATFVGFLFVEYLGNDAWRWMLASSAVPGIIVLLVRMGTPESPRWLLLKGRNEEALKVVKQVYGDDATLDSIINAEQVKTVKPGFKSLLTGIYLKRLIFCGLFYLCAVTPVFAIYTFGPIILGSFGMAGGNAANIGYALISLLFLIGCLPAISIADKIGSRTLLIWSFAIMIVPFLALGVSPEMHIGWIIFWFCLYALASGGPNILEWSYPNEIFPTEIRATAMGVVVAISRIGAAVGTFLIPISLDAFGIGPTMLYAMVLTMVGFVITYLLAPETKGKSLVEAST